jgi:S1-C subfamily serine protease
MAAGDIAGLRLTGVRAGSPAEEGGLKAGDVIVEFGGTPVKDLEEYSQALYSHKPGDDVSIVVLRNSQRLTLKVRLGKRGG